MRRNWTRDELIAALALYRVLPFGRMDSKNAEIIALAQAVGRSPSAVALKLVNFASFDPMLQARGIRGMSNSGKGDRLLWEEFADDWDSLATESERIIAGWEEPTVATPIPEDFDTHRRVGRERDAVVRVRIGQNLFRNSVLRAYGFRCCISGLSVPELLNASHIVPWKADANERLNPRNGLCLNAVLDRAFDRGMITILTDYTVKVSNKIKYEGNDSAFIEMVARYDRSLIRLPFLFSPTSNFLEYHNAKVFKG